VTGWNSKEILCEINLFADIKIEAGSPNYGNIKLFVRSLYKESALRSRGWILQCFSGWTSRVKLLFST
jgi:hypothetical protein